MLELDLGKAWCLFWGTFPSSHEVIANHGIQQTIHRHLPWKRTRSTRYVFYTNIDPIFWYAPIRSCVYLNDREWSWLYISTPVLVLWIGWILWFTSVCQNHMIYTYIYIYIRLYTNMLQNLTDGMHDTCAPATATEACEKGWAPHVRSVATWSKVRSESPLSSA